MSMKILVYGAGAVGGYLGGKLAQRGHSVALVCRPDTAEQINAQGLVITEPGSLTNQQVTAFGSLGQAAERFPDAELIILGMKSYDLAPAMSALAATSLAPSTIMTTQNGIGIEEIVSRNAGSACVVAGAVTIPVRREAGNHLIVEKRGRGLGLAAVDGGITIDPLETMLSATGIETVAIADYRAMKWSKALLNSMSNATSAILDMSPRELYQIPAIVDLESRMLRETLAVMDRLQIPVVDLPGAPVRWLVRGIRLGPYLLMRAILRRGVAGSRGDKMPSFHIDFQSGRKQSEVVFHNGAIADAGAAAGLVVTVNRALNDILMELVRGNADPATYAHRPDRLVAEIERYS